MRDLNEIVNRNVRRFIDEEIKRAAEDGRELTDHMVAARAAESMGIPHNTAYKQLCRNLKEGRGWTANYIQGFASAVGKTPQDLVTLGPGDAGVSDCTIAQSLFTALNHRMKTPAVRGLVREIQRQLDYPPLFEFIRRLNGRLVDAESKEEAYEITMDLIRETNAFGPRPRDLRGKKKKDRKSK